MLYNPKHFVQTNADGIKNFITRVKFATLITRTQEDIEISHVPMVLKAAGEDVADWQLECHVARPNPHAGALGASVAVFLGPQAYVSPNWYASKREHGKVVPTWNYAVVHASGTLEAMAREEELLAHLHDVTNANEQNQQTPWKVADAPQAFLAGQMGAIVGLRLRVARVDGKWKMSQNRSEADRAGVYAGFARLYGEDSALMAAMREGNGEG